jgi:hypothetical protein
LALIGNHYRQGASPATNQLGGTNVGSMDRQHAYLPGRVRGFYVGQACGPDVAAQSFPPGYRHPGAWHLSPKAGGVSARITASGSVAAAGQMGYPIAAALTGSGEITNAELGLILSALAALSGTGSVAGSAIGVATLAAALSGSGGVSDAGIYGIGTLVAALSGTGDLSDAEIYAIGLVAADIVVTGTGLTTANVGQAVWAAIAASNNAAGTMGEKLNDAGSASNPWTEIIESGYTAAEILRLIVAHAAGAASGLESGTPTFKSLDGTKDRIAGTYADGERGITDLDAS